MKVLNFFISIGFLVLSLVAGIFAWLTKRIDLGCLSGVCALLSFVAYKDFRNEEDY
jgi:branched-subunit amino acid transport protein